MKPNQPDSLFRDLWPTIDRALLEEPREERLNFISELLRVFQSYGADLSKLSPIDEDVKTCADRLTSELPRSEPSAKSDKVDQFTYEIPDDSEILEIDLVGGQFDGMSLRMSNSIERIPPESITFEALKDNSDLKYQTVYELQVITDFDKLREPTSQCFAYMVKNHKS